MRLSEFLKKIKKIKKEKGDIECLVYDKYEKKYIDLENGDFFVGYTENVPQKKETYFVIG